MKSTYHRLEEMETLISKEEFIQPQGIGSDIPHFVLDYPPEEEMQIRVYIKNMLSRTTTNIKEVNLFSFLLSFFDKEEMDELYEVCEDEGLKGLYDVFEPILNEKNSLIQQFMDVTKHADVIFITGVGTAHPFLRSSQLLKAISSKGYKKPIILFYPGSFTGLRLKLFGILDYEDDYQLSRIS
ncbi:DUF1788 domain-containing protein [Salibacterium sp. K-3]